MRWMVSTPGELLTRVGSTLVYRVGGAAGPLFGGCFRQVGSALGTTETFDAEDLLKALRAGLDAIQGLGAAVEGDKTIVDAFVPALQALERELRAGRDVAQAVHRAAEAAKEGVARDDPDAGAEGPCLLPGAPERRTSGSGCHVYGAALRRVGEGGRRPVVTATGERRGTIQSVDRAARILKALGSGSSRLGVTEVADRLGLAKGTVYGLLRTLEAQELVEQDPESGKYRLGPAMLQLGNAFLDNHELRGRSLLWADSLASRVGEAVRVGVLHGPNVLIVHHVFRPDNSVQILEVGASIPWHACALGKAIVAYLGEDGAGGPGAPRPGARSPGGRSWIPSGCIWRSTTVVHDGLALEDQEAIVGEAEIAAAVFDHRGYPAGAVGVVGPVERLVPEGKASAALSAAVRETARGLSRDMGAGRVAARG